MVFLDGGKKMTIYLFIYLRIVLYHVIYYLEIKCGPSKWLLNTCACISYGHRCYIFH